MPVNTNVTIYITGIQKGSSEELHPQTYRKQLVDAIRETWDSAILQCPMIADTQENDEQLKDTVRDFEQQLTMLKKASIVVAFIPEASMGSAIELYNASLRGKYVVTISPMRSNRIIRLFSHDIYDSVDSFINACQVGKFKKDYSRFIIEKSKRTTSIAPRFNDPLKKNIR